MFNNGSSNKIKNQKNYKYQKNMETGFANALIQLCAEDLEVLTTEVKESIVIENKRQKLGKQLTVADFWNIKKNRKVFGRRKYLTDQDLEVV